MFAFPSMEGNVVSSYLCSKISSTLKEAEAEVNATLISRFQSINERLTNNTNKESGSTVDQLYDLMGALSEYIIFGQKAASKKGFRYLFRKEKLIRKMSSLLSSIEETLKDSGHDKTVGPSGVVILQSYPYDLSMITGFESQVGEIEELLFPMSSPADERGDQFKVIGIVGMCGSGKTTLARKVISSRRVDHEYIPRVWVGLSGTGRLFDSSDVRERILKLILREIWHQDDASDLDYRGYSVVKLLEILRLRLEGKRYLIVLDDAWQLDEWFADLSCTGPPGAESFTHGLPKGSGGAVIVTSLRENLVRRMVGENYVSLPLLSDESCWKIFSDDVRQQGKVGLDHPKLIQMKESVIKNCQGSPLAAKTLANVISNLLAEGIEI